MDMMGGLSRSGEEVVVRNTTKTGFCSQTNLIGRIPSIIQVMH